MNKKGVGTWVILSMVIFLALVLVLIAISSSAGSESGSIVERMLGWVFT